LLTRAVLAVALPFVALACDRVPEQALRDEQSRSRQYREAFESEHDENVALRARVEQLEKKKCDQGASR
jgi:hypothetical protein